MKINSKNKTKDSSYSKQYRDNWERVFNKPHPGAIPVIMPDVQNMIKKAEIEHLRHFCGIIPYNDLVHLVLEMIDKNCKYNIDLTRVDE